MYKKKEKLYINDLLPSPLLSYPSYYCLSSSMAKNDFLHCAIIALHSMNFEGYEIPNTHDKIFEIFSSGAFCIYKENYIVGYLGDKMMYLEPNGWRAMPVNADVFRLENWLV